MRIVSPARTAPCAVPLSVIRACRVHTISKGALPIIEKLAVNGWACRTVGAIHFIFFDIVGARRARKRAAGTYHGEGPDSEMSPRGGRWPWYAFGPAIGNDDTVDIEK